MFKILQFAKINPREMPKMQFAKINPELKISISANYKLWMAQVSTKVWDHTAKKCTRLGNRRFDVTQEQTCDVNF